MVVRISFNHEDVGSSSSKRGKKEIAANLVQPCPIQVGPKKKPENEGRRETTDTVRTQLQKKERRNYESLVLENLKSGSGTAMRKRLGVVVVIPNILQS